MTIGDRGMKWRAAAVLLTAGVFLALAIVLYRVGPSLGGWWPGCMFHRLTGAHCPGCGMTRATYALLHLRIGTAFALNPLVVSLLPFITVGIGLEILAWVRGPQRPTPRLKLKRWMTITLVVVVLAYWILRNLPWWPFTLLAP